MLALKFAATRDELDTILRRAIATHASKPDERGRISTLELYARLDLGFFAAATILCGLLAAVLGSAGALAVCVLVLLLATGSFVSGMFESAAMLRVLRLRSVEMPVSVTPAEDAAAGARISSALAALSLSTAAKWAFLCAAAAACGFGLFEMEFGQGYATVLAYAAGSLLLSFGAFGACLMTITLAVDVRDRLLRRATLSGWVPGHVTWRPRLLPWLSLVRVGLAVALFALLALFVLAPPTVPRSAAKLDADSTKLARHGVPAPTP